MERTPDQHYETKWTANSTNSVWTLYIWPFYLVIEHHSRADLPYVGSLSGRMWIKRDHYAWATPEEAALGMIDWALHELSTSYHELLKLRSPETPQ